MQEAAGRGKIFRMVLARGKHSGLRDWEHFFWVVPTRVYTSVLSSLLKNASELPMFSILM
jgi:hypothetical protein